MMIFSRYISLAIILFFSLSTLYAQEEQSFKHQLKLSLFLDTDTVNGGLTFGTLAPAYVNRNEKGFTHTLEFHKLIWNTQETIIGTTNNRGAVVRHQADFPLGPQWSICQFTLGSSVKLSYVQARFVPKVASSFQADFYEGKAAIGTLPALHVYPQPRIDLSIGALIGIADLFFESNRIANPALPAIEQRTDTFGSDVALQFQSLVIGLAYQF